MSSSFRYKRELRWCWDQRQCGSTSSDMILCHRIAGKLQAWKQNYIPINTAQRFNTAVQLDSHTTSVTRTFNFISPLGVTWNHRSWQAGPVWCNHQKNTTMGINSCTFQIGKNTSAHKFIGAIVMFSTSEGLPLNPEIWLFVKASCQSMLFVVMVSWTLNLPSMTSLRAA